LIRIDRQDDMSYVLLIANDRGFDMQNYIIDAANRRWGIRRTCANMPARAYHAMLIDDIDDTSDILPGIIGFYAETIDDAKRKLLA